MREVNNPTGQGNRDIPVSPMCPHIPPVGTCRQRPCVRQETWRFSGYLRRCPPLPSWYITLHIVSSSMLGLEVKL